MRPSPLKSLLIPCLLLLAFTVPHLDQGDFRRDTGRYAAVGHYMLSAPTPWWQPFLNPDTPYFNKPPLALLIHGAFLKAFGVSLAVARIPSVLAALGVVILSVLSVRLIGSKVEAVTSGIVLALTYEFFRRTREISLDLWQLFFVMLAVFLVLYAAKSERKAFVLLAGVPLGLSLLCKPLVGLGTLPIFALWFVFLRRPGWIWLLFVGVLPIALTVAFPWHYAMWREYGSSFIDQYLGNQVVDRARGKLSSNPPYFFVSLLARTYWPWALFAAFSVWLRFRPAGRAVRSANRDLVLLGGTWVAVVLASISIFPDKKVNYALPIYPMLAWLAAAGICRLPWRRLRSWYARGLRGIAPTAAVGLVLVSALPIQFQKPDPDWRKMLQWAGPGTAERLVYRNLPAGDICYFYLRTGRWLQPAPAEQVATLAGEHLVITRLSTKDGPGRTPVFRSGNLAVYAD